MTQGPLPLAVQLSLENLIFRPQKVRRVMTQMPRPHVSPCVMPETELFSLR